MELADKLINKKYYEKFIDGNETMHPIQVLAEAYIQELRSETELSFIRFSQGEVYFHHKDYETAIFKWENMNNELETWARKNMADAYYKLGNLSTAKSIYQSIDVDDLTLMTEVELQLFSIYKLEGKFNEAVDIIKRIVSKNPDYPNVSDLALSFFEEFQDWGSAIELAVNEGIRTETEKWFDILTAYVDRGLTNTIAPTYFSTALETLANINLFKFEQLVSSFWNNYVHEQHYFSWIQVINEIFLKINVNQSELWFDLSTLYEKTFSDLISGKYFFKELSDVIPNLLSSWLKLAPSPIIASSAVLSWNDMFPNNISTAIVKEAENNLSQAKYSNFEISDIVELINTIIQWTKNNNIEVPYLHQWLVNEMTDLNTNYLLVSGNDDKKKLSIINSLLEENTVDFTPTTLMMFKDYRKVEINKITNSEVQFHLSVNEFQSIASSRRKAPMIEYKLPSKRLRELRMALINIPNWYKDGQKKDWLPYVLLGDSLLCVFKGQTPLTEEERFMLHEIQEYAPTLDIQILLMNEKANSREFEKLVEETKAEVNTYFPNAKVWSLPSEGANNIWQSIQAFFAQKDYKKERKEKLLLLIRIMIKHLMARPKELETNLAEMVKWEEEAVIKLSGAINQLSDLEIEQKNVIQNTYQIMREEIQAKIRKQLINNIPRMLQECSQWIKEDSNFQTIHVELNQQMNDKIRSYINKSIIPQLSNAILSWVKNAGKAFQQSQSHVTEMANSLNAFYEQEQIELLCDFKVLDDWRRDVDRMINRIELEDMNIMLGLKPAQLILRSSGKLLGALPINKTLLQKGYKKLVESEDYQHVVDTIIKQLFMQLELFEKGLEHDMALFFKGSAQKLMQERDGTQLNIKTNQAALNNLKANPEVYLDPLKLFEVRLRQYEKLINPQRGLSPTTLMR